MAAKRWRGEISVFTKTREWTDSVVFSGIEIPVAIGKTHAHTCQSGRVSVGHAPDTITLPVRF